MTTKADWRLPDLSLDEDDDDPFSGPVEELGTPIDLSDQEGRLNARLVELLNQEQRLDSSGIRCAIKDRPDTCCSACPVSKAGDQDARLYPLCRAGREQERVCTEMAALSCPELVNPAL